MTRLHTDRQSSDAVIHRLLDEEVARDPIPREEQETGRLYLVTQPLTAPRDLAVSLVRGNDLSVHNLVTGSESKIPQDVREFAPTPNSASNTVIRAEGTARCSSATTGPGRTYYRHSDWSDEEDLLDIEFCEDGGIRLLMGRMTATWSRGGDARTVVADGLAVGYALRVVHSSTEIGRLMNYHGSWAYGLAAHGLRGLSSSVYNESLSNIRSG